MYFNDRYGFNWTSLRVYSVSIIYAYICPENWIEVNYYIQPLLTGKPNLIWTVLDHEWATTQRKCKYIESL